MSIRTSGSRPDDNSLRFTFIVEGRITKGNPPFAVVQRGKRCELVKGHDINQKVHDALWSTRKRSGDILSAALLRTPGGFINVGSPVVASIGLLEYENVGTTAFVIERAQSYGAEILANCRRRIALPDAEFTWHQTYLKDKNDKTSQSDRPILDRPREEFRTDFRTWLEKMAAPEHQHWLLSRAEDAFADPKNQLDDVDFSGWELKRARLIDQTVEDIERLGIAYARTMNLDPSAWHPKVRKFFTTQA